MFVDPDDYILPKGLYNSYYILYIILKLIKQILYIYYILLL